MGNYLTQMKQVLHCWWKFFVKFADLYTVHIHVLTLNGSFILNLILPVCLSLVDLYQSCSTCTVFWCISSNLYSWYSFRAPRACGRSVVRVHRPRNHAPVLWADSKDPGTVQPCCQTAHHRYRYRRKHITEIWCLPAGNQIPNKLLLYLIFL